MWSLARYVEASRSPGGAARRVRRAPKDAARLGHSAPGSVQAIGAGWSVLRRTPVTRGKWLFFIVTCICLAISACYEFIEWGTAVVGGSSADAFLGTQGDIWDTQWDMFTALWGAIISQLLLARVHDRQLAALIGHEGA
mgnify:CR=1 FL=1